MNRRTRPLLAIIVAATFGLASTSAALAQHPDSPPKAAEPATDFSRTELKSFAVALLDVQRINQKTIAKIGKAQNVEEETIARSEAQQDMVKAVHEAGLSVSRYNHIAQEVRADPELATRVERYVQQAK